MEKVLVKNVADVKQVKNAENRILNGRDREMNDLRSVLSTREGRRFIWRYLGICGLMSETFTGNSGTFHAEGKRSIGVMLNREIAEADADAYILMMKEAQLGL